MKGRSPSRSVISQYLYNVVKIGHLEIFPRPAIAIRIRIWDVEASYIASYVVYGHPDPTAGKREFDQRPFLKWIRDLYIHQVNKVAGFGTRDDLSTAVSAQTVHVHEETRTAILVIETDGAHGTGSPEIR